MVKLKKKNESLNCVIPWNHFYSSMYPKIQIYMGTHDSSHDRNRGLVKVSNFIIQIVNSKILEKSRPIRYASFVFLV